jgi:hypothetical protein
MDRDIKVVVADRVATSPTDAVIVCGNSDYTILFQFDDEWEGVEAKTARFKYSAFAGPKQHIDVPFTGDAVQVPMLTNAHKVEVGVYAGNLKTSTGARIHCLPSIRCGSGAEVEPNPDKYDALMDLIKGGGLNGQSAYEAAKAGGYEGTEEEFQKALADIASGDTGGGIVEETDPTVHDWAKKPEKPEYNASEIAYQNETLGDEVKDLQTGLDTAVDYVITKIPEIEKKVDSLPKERPTAQTEGLDWQGLCSVNSNTLYIHDMWGLATEIPLGTQIKAIEIKPEGHDEWTDLSAMHEVDSIPYCVNMTKAFMDSEGTVCFALVAFPVGTNFLYQALESFQSGLIRITYYTD